MTGPPSPELPYHDTKPKGAADFYLAINATFRFMENRLGMEGLRCYWSDLGRAYYAPVAQRWQLGGLPAIAQYWRSFFDAEPGSDVTVEQHEQEVRVEVRTCPAIAHLRTHQREIVSCFCQHCYFVSESIAAPAGFTVRVTGGNGACLQQFMPMNRADLKPQNLEDIARAS